MNRSLLLFALFSCVLAQDYSGIGDMLTRTFGVFHELPLTTQSANAAGWKNLSGDCDPNLGYAFYEDDNEAPTKAHPITLFFSASGQLSGFGLSHFGAPEESLQGIYWMEQQDGSYMITISTRSSDENLCDDGNVSNSPLGTVVIINQGGLNRAIPLTSADASQELYTRGSCIGGMGRHWSYDLAAAPNMTWKVENYMPVTPMYSESTGNIAGIFIETNNLQWVEPFGDFEGPFISAIMCKNYCDNSCSWDATAFTTLHFGFYDHVLNSCDSRCD